MVYYDWDKEKNKKLKIERSISFEEVIIALEVDGLIDEINNPSKNFPDQKVFVIQIFNYLYYVPFVKKSDETIFLKTIIPSRKILKKYMNK
ncbi:MAG: toxin [Candidatus Roizmanbacteria bacterium]